MTLRWSKRARADLVAIAEYIAVDNPLAAWMWVERLTQCAMLVADVPHSGRSVPEFGRADVRETFLRSYRIVYRVMDDGIFVLTVLEGHRRLGHIDPDANR